MRTAAPLSLTTATVIALVASSVHAEIAWRDNLRTAHAEAQADGKQLLLHFYTDNCAWCDKLEAGAFQAPQVQQSINQRFVPVKVHAARNPKLTQMFSVKKFPTDVVVTTQGETLSHSVSPQDPNRYVAMLTEALTKPANPAAHGEDSAIASQTPGVVENPLANGASPPSGAGQVSGAGQANGATQRHNEFVLPAARSDQTPAQFASSRDSAGGLTMPAASSAPAATGGSDANQPELSPAETKQPELAIQGFCAVSVIEEDRWVEGTPEFGVIHLGKLYLFASAEKMQMFLDDPVPYTPVLNEIDVVRFFEERRIVPGKREWGLKDPVHQRMFFFADESAMNHFWNKHELYTEAAVQIMDQAIKDANP